MQTNSLRYRRKMGARERMRLWFPNINVVMAAVVQGTISGGQVDQALSALRQKHPLLGVRIEIDQAQNGWFTTENVPDIPVQEGTLCHVNDWQTYIGTAIRHEWSFATGPLASVTVLAAPDHTVLLLTAHHSICDGRSLVYLVQDLLTYLGEPDQVDSTEPAIPIMVEEAATNAKQGGFLTRLVINIMNKRWLAKGITFGENDYHQLHRFFWADKQPGFQSMVLPQGQVAQIIQRCRQEGCTVNSLLYTAFLLAQRKVQEIDNDTVLVPVDLRNFLDLPTKRLFDYYASAVVMDYQIDPDQPFWDRVHEFDRQVKNKVTHNEVFASLQTALFTPSLLDGVVFAMFGDFKDNVVGRLANRMFRQLSKRLMLSNLGRVQLPNQYGAYELVALHPPIVYSGHVEKIVEVLTFNDQMYFSVTYEETKIATPVVRSILDEIESLLHQQVA